MARLVEQWLSVFGPGTAADVKWWLGSTLAAIQRRSLTSLPLRTTADADSLP